MPTISVHIGIHKTGTTALQYALWQARGMLAEAGIIYPDRRANHSEDLYTMFGEQPDTYLPNVVRGRSGGALEAYRAECFAAWGNILETAPEDAHIVVSGEDLSRFGAEEWRRFTEFFGPNASAMEFVAVVREPVSWATSSVQQTLKGGRAFSDPGIAGLQQGVRRRLEPLLEVAGRDAVSVLRFEDLVASEDGLVKALARELGVPADTARRLGDGRRNETLTEEGALLLATLNEAVPYRENIGEEGPRFHGDFKAFLSVDGSPFMLTTDEQDRVLKTWHTDRKFLEEHFGITVKPVARQTVGERRRVIEDRRALASIASQLVQGQLDAQALRRLKRQNERLRERHAALRRQARILAVSCLALLVLALMGWFVV
ncbi:hypothetical protein [Parvularcula lutaonensis]|uniref:Sulfotransferase family protein n=1 Tax=Parvularcula lutaonensis TaxID=491923 RepID=A0ABV7MAM7_9PROT|nr:hypothetical protein [Parvularcula lutaonensis]GGY45998.1 hypothetical protein GCM10007148_13850 [Parvularcula lutaonensis]